MTEKILVINGPNLNLLGSREKEKYGNVSLQDIQKKCEEHSDKIGLIIEFKQSNLEGEIVNFIQDAKEKYQGIIINAGGYTHTSVAISDAIAAIKTPVIEVHISNIYAREEYRQKSLIASNCKGSICGFGLKSYILAIESLMK